MILNLVVYFVIISVSYFPVSSVFEIERKARLYSESKVGGWK